MEISVKTVVGKTIKLEVEPGNTIEDIKAKIHDREGTPPNQQNLVFAGRDMLDHYLLYEQGITHGATLHLVLRRQSAGS